MCVCVCVCVWVCWGRWHQIHVQTSDASMSRMTACARGSTHACHVLVLRQDAFIGRLLALLRDTRPVRAAQAAAGRPELSLGVHRSDYMLDAPSQGFLQVRCWLLMLLWVACGVHVAPLHRAKRARSCPQGVHTSAY